MQKLFNGGKIDGKLNTDQGSQKSPMQKSGHVLQERANSIRMNGIYCFSNEEAELKNEDGDHPVN